MLRIRSRFWIAAPLLSFIGFVACDEDSTSTPNPSGDGGASSSSGGSGTSGTSGTSSSSGAPNTASLTWTKATVTGADLETIGGIAAMAFGGGRFVAIARANTPLVDKLGFALTSTDGKAWTQAAAFKVNYRVATLVYTGTQFVTSGTMPNGDGTGGVAVYGTTTDGASWTWTEMAGVADEAVTVATSVGQTLHFAGVKGLMAIEGDGAAATAYTSPFVGSTVLATCVVGTRVITAGSVDASKPTDPLLTYSDDVSKSDSWKAGTEPNALAREASRFSGLACDDTRQIAVGAGKEIWFSTDRGATWSANGSEGDSTTWRKIEKANGKYVIVGWKGVYGVTADGTDLATGTIGSERDFESAATDGTIVVAGAGGLYNEKVGAEFWWARP